MTGSQKFIARNRAPRVQIEYDVELYGAEKKVQLPFVMGVMSDLSGKAEKPTVDQRAFLEIDADNFDDRMRSIAPKAQFYVPNTLTGEGNLSVDLTFARMDDFSPEAIASKVETLAPLLEARRQLSELMTYMDGKAGAETLIETLLSQPALLRALAQPGEAQSDVSDALESLRAALPETAEQLDESENTLAALAARAPQDEPSDTSVDDVLSAIEIAPDIEPDPDASHTVLSDLATAASETAPPDTTIDDVLSGLEPAPEAETSTATGDVLSGLADAAVDVPGDVDEAADVLASLERMAEPAPEDDPVSDALSGITRADVVPNAPDDTDDILAGLEPVVPVVDATENLDDILNALDVAPEPGADAQDLDDILGDLGVTDADDVEAEAMSDALNSIDTSVSVPDTPGDDIDDILAGVESPAEEEQEQASAEDIFSSGDKLAEEGAAGDDVADVLVAMPEPGLDAVQPSQDLDSLLSDLSVPSDTEKTPEEDLNGILGDLGGVEAHSAEVASGETDLDALLSDLGGDETEALTTDETEQTPAKADGLDDLLSDLGVDTDVSVVEVQQDAATDDLDALLSDLAEDEPATATEETDDLDALLSDLAVEPAKALGDSTPGADAPPTQSPFGTLSALRPERANLHRPTFRMALFGDFTGRSVRGVLETGDALASRKPIELDVDTVEEVIEGFATTLRLPIGRDGDSINVKLGGLDDLHPDELYDNVEIFEALAGLRQQLEVGSIANSTIERLKAWSEAYGTPVQLPKHSGSTSVPAHLKLSDFQALIGDTEGAHGTTSPVDEMIAKIVGPHIVKAPDAGVDVMKTAVDAALSGAMRLVLHHPDFQAIEAQWRSLDLLARRLETDSSLQIVLYDVSAEELAADLAAQEDLAESGIFRLLTEVLDPEEGAGGFSALFGLYTFEETPPHAELLARIGQVAAHIDAPFFAAMAPTYLDTAVEDRHPLVAKTWDTLRTLPEAAYIGLASPRFLLRQPYGAKSDPISPFAFEEFTPRDGLRSLLWANPVVLVAVLLAATYKKDGKAMGLGSLMSLGDLPFHYVTDRHGDQVALPSTERNLTSAPTQSTLARGYMPVVWMKGRNEVRLGSFRSLGGDEIAGPWSSEVPAPRSQSEGNVGATIALDVEIGEDNGESLDDLLAGFEDDLGSREDTDADAMDADLAALLEGL